jgi:hypothetical protein
MSKAPWKWACWNTRLGTIVADAAPASAKWTTTFPDAYAEKSDAVRARLSKNGLPPTGGGHVTIDSQTGAFTLTTPRTCGGFAETGEISAGPFSASIDSSATVWASSLDGKDLSESSHVLVTHLTDLQNTGARFADTARSVLLDWGRLPYLVRDGKAKIELHLPFVNTPAAWRVWALAPDGTRVVEVPCRVESGCLAFTASVRQPFGACLSYEIAKE